MTALPRLGVGIGYRNAIRSEIIRHHHEFDFLEVITDTFFKNPEGLRAVSSLLPCIPHSLNLSIGSEVDDAYLEDVSRIVSLLDPPWHSDHLAYTKADGLEIGHLAPIPYTLETLDTVERNVRKVQARIERPFAVENITMPFYWPVDSIDEADFLSELVRRTGCHLLLDLENVRINASNHRGGRGAERFLDRLPLERVAQVHVAGGVHAEGLAHDSHNAPVPEETWSLLEYLCELAPPPGVLLERDAGFGDFPELVAEVRRARGMLKVVA